MKHFLQCLALVFSMSISAQPAIEWQKTYGGNSYDEPYSIKQTSDDGFIVAGISLFSNGDVTEHLGGFDFWILKLHNSGSIEWSKVLGGTGNEVPYSIFQTVDGGYFIAGYTESNDHDIAYNHGNLDGWVVKLDSAGNIEWEKTLGGSGRDEIWAARQTTDNGYILAGRSNSSDGDVSKNQGLADFWVLKLDSTGVIEWEKTLGGSQDDIAYSIKQTDDGGYIAVGETASSDGDVTGLRGNIDFWIVKLSPEGDPEWEKTLGGNNWDRGNDIVQTSDGGYVVTGFIGSATGDITVHYGLFDYWLAKLDNTGALEWQKTFGGSQGDRVRKVLLDDDGGCIIFGSTESNNYDVTGNHGDSDFWILKTSSSGELLWQKSYGGNLGESGFDIDKTADNGFVLAGYAWSSNNGDLMGSQNRGKADFWVVKLSPESVSVNNVQKGIAHLELYPNPSQHSVYLNLPAENTDVDVSISDLLGRKILQVKMPGNRSLDISSLNSGLYILTASTPEGKVFCGKLEKVN